MYREPDLISTCYDGMIIITPKKGDEQEGQQAKRHLRKVRSYLKKNDLYKLRS